MGTNAWGQSRSGGQNEEGWAGDLHEHVQTPAYGPSVGLCGILRTREVVMAFYFGGCFGVLPSVRW